MTNGGGRGPGGAERDARLRHLAVQLAGQLPDDMDDARAVVRLMDVLIRDFLAAPTDGGPLSDDNIMQLRARIAPSSKPPDQN